MRSLLLTLILAALPAWALAQQDSHAVIRQEKHALEQAFEKQLAECQNRFAVSECVERARRQRRAAIKPLQDRELRLDDAERQRRAEARRQTLAEKGRRAAEMPPAPPTDLRAREPTAPHHAAPRASGSASGPLSVPMDPAALEAARRAAERQSEASAAAASRAKAAERADAASDAGARVEAARRRAEAQAAIRARVARKEAERKAKGKAAVPLPVPAASAIP